MTDSWPSFDGLDRDSKHVRKIRKLLETAKVSFLSEEASKIRRALDWTVRTRSKRLTCSIDASKFASGHNSVVVELKFSDSTSWIARIRLPSKAAPNEEVERSLLSEIITLRLVKSKTSIPVPEVYGFDSSLPNTFGYRYLLMCF